MIEAKIQAKLRAQYNPEGSDLRKLQMRMLDMLKFIDQVCRDHNIKYWLSSGTCLGAVRHGGFIPWDDDVDIEMLSDDYKKFCNIFKNINSEKYVLQTHETDFEYTFSFAKVRELKSKIKENNEIYLRYKYKGVFIDIFPLYSSSWIIAKSAMIMQILMLYKLSLIRNDVFRKRLLKINYFILHRCIFPIFNGINKCLSNKNKLKMGGLGSGFVETYDRKIVEDLIEVEFEGLKLPIPKEYEKYLSALYGDYMQLPPEEKRHGHHLQGTIDFGDYS